MHKLWKRFFCALLVLGCLVGVAPAGQAAVQNLPNEIFLTQEGNGTCTLCSAAMVIRSSMYLHGNEDWEKVIQEALRSAAWISGVGLKWSFTFTTESCSVQMAHRAVNGISVEELKAVLDQHPEGIVLYSKDVPHAVFLMGYEGDRFYCAETVAGYSGKKILLEESWMGKKYGSQEALLKKVSAYWFVASYKDKAPAPCVCGEEYAGVYRVTTVSENLRIRSGHGVHYSVVGSLPMGTEVVVTKASGIGDSDWAHVTYNGVSGYVSMQYLTKVSNQMQGAVTASSLRIRSGPGTGYKILGYLEKGDRVEILETKDAGGMTWGRTAKGWISLDYVALDQPGQFRIVTVNADCLRIRSAAGTTHKIVGYLYMGDQVKITEETMVNGTVWGKTSQGWISLDYAK